MSTEWSLPRHVQGSMHPTLISNTDSEFNPASTYSEFMIWVDARRRAESVKASIDGLEAGGEREGKDDGRKSVGVTE